MYTILRELGHLNFDGSLIASIRNRCSQTGVTANIWLLDGAKVGASHKPLVPPRSAPVLVTIPRIVAGHPKMFVRNFLCQSQAYGFLSPPYNSDVIVYGGYALFNWVNTSILWSPLKMFFYNNCQFCTPSFYIKILAKTLGKSSIIPWPFPQELTAINVGWTVAANFRRRQLFLSTHYARVCVDLRV